LRSTYSEIPVATIVTGDTKVTLSWNSVSGADKYNIYYATETFEDVEVANYASLNNYHYCKKTIDW
jgi:hypothetical protein